jgi:hypothetical protein
MRRVANALAVVVLSASAATSGAWVAVEAIAAIAGYQGNLLPINYRSWWADLQGWNLSQGETTAIYAGIGAAGLLLLATQLLSRKAPQADRRQLAGGSQVAFDGTGLDRFLEAGLRQVDGVEGPRVLATMKGQTVDVATRFRPTRPITEGDVAKLRESVVGDLYLLGLRAGNVESRATHSRNAGRVR